MSSDDLRTASEPTPDQTEPRRTSLLDRVRRHFFIIVIAAVVVGFLAREVSRNFFAYSSDAYVTSDIITVAPAVEGIVTELHVVENQKVAEHDPLFVIDLKPYQYAVDLQKAEVNLAELTLVSARDQVKEAQDDEAAAKATLDDAQATHDRIKDLVDKGVASKQQFDDVAKSLNTASADHNKMISAITVAQDIVNQASAQIESAKAQLAIAEYNLQRATVLAPDGGHVAPFQTRVGDYLNVGDPVLAIVTDDNWRIVVNLPEQNLGRLEIGQETWVMVSSKPWRLYKGKVKSFSRGISRSESSTRALPYVQPTTDWIRLSRRFPVEIDMGELPKELPLFMGSDARVLILH